MITTQRVDDPEDPRLADYRALNDPQRRRRHERVTGRFVAEGELVVRRAAELGWAVRSVVLAEGRVAPMADVVDDLARRGTAVLVVDRDVLASTVGFDLHRGVVAVLDRPSPVAWTEVAARAVAGARLVVAEGLVDPENLGALFRNAAAFGAAGLVLDPTCVDPFHRRAVRVSMGHVLAVPWARADPWPAVLHDLASRGVEVVALTPRGDADVDDAGLGARGRVALVLGAEGSGLSPAALAAATVRVRIPMAPAVDSLNVATAAAVALHAVRWRGPAGAADLSAGAAG